MFSWKVDRHLPTAKLSIPDEYLLQLMDETGLAGYTDNSMCNASVGIYSTTAINGWTNGKKKCVYEEDNLSYFLDNKVQMIDRY